MALESAAMGIEAEIKRVIVAAKARAKSTD